MKFKFNVDVYDFNVTFTTDKAYADRVTENGTDIDYGNFYCYESPRDHKIVILAASPTLELTPFYLQCLSHECNHAAMSILGTLGIEFSRKQQEVLCYLQDYIFCRILNKLWSCNESSSLKKGVD